LLAQDHDGRTAWLLAAEYGNIQVLDMLWELPKRKLTTEELNYKVKSKTIFHCYTNIRRKLTVCRIQVHLSSILFTGKFALMAYFCVEFVVISRISIFPII
jgi:hypothetical protein